MRSGSFRTLQTRAVASRSLIIFVLSVLSGCRASTENVASSEPGSISSVRTARFKRSTITGFSDAKRGPSNRIGR